MRISILLSIVFELLEKGKMTADYLSKKHEISHRTVYRYIETLAPFLPLHIKRGRGGGICLADNCRLPNGFMTKAEYTALYEALENAYAQTGEKRFLQVKRKFDEQSKREEFPSYIAAEVGEITVIPDKKDPQFTLLQVLQECIREKLVAELLVVGEKAPRKSEPVSLMLQQNEWKVLAFCYAERTFLTFPLSSLRGARKTEENFHPRSVHFALPMYGLNGFS